jgi:hypothetical protein
LTESGKPRSPRARPAATGDHLLAPDRPPVPVPSDEAAVGSGSLATWLAVFVLVAAVVGGVVYQQHWVDAGGEVARLVPASTPAYVAIPLPAEQLARARALERFADPAALERDAQTAGPLAEGVAGTVAGVPFDVLRRLWASADTLRVVTQPGTAGSAVLLFFEIANERDRRVLRHQLQSALATTGRVMGHAIESFVGDAQPLPWTDETQRTRLVELEPHIVLGFGSDEVLDDLIQARVTGRTQPIARRDGFDVDAESRGAPMWAALDPAWLADLARPLVDRVVVDPVAFRLSVVDRVRSLDFTDSFDGPDERVWARIQTRDGAFTEALRPALRGSGHALLRTLPAPPRVAVSLSLESAAAGLEALARLLPRVTDILIEDDAPDQRAIAARFSAMRAAAGTADLDRAFRGELVWFAPAAETGGPAWLFAVGVADSALAEGVIETMVAAALGPDWRFGTVFGGGSAWHIAELDDRAGVEGERPRLVWRVLDGVAIFAPSVAALESVEGWAREGAPSLAVVERAVRVLPPRPVLVILADTATLEAAGPPGTELVAARLRPDFLAAASLEVDADGLSVVSNIGALTALAALSATDSATLDVLGGAPLPDDCAAAVDILCRNRPLGFLCEPFASGRRARLADACAQAR